MKASDYLKSMTLKERDRLAKRIGTSLGYLNLVSGGHRQLGPRLAKKLVKESGGAVTLAEVRPDLWGDEGAA